MLRKASAEKHLLPSLKRNFLLCLYLLLSMRGDNLLGVQGRRAAFACHFRHYPIEMKADYELADSTAGCAGRCE